MSTPSSKSNAKMTFFWMAAASLLIAVFTVGSVRPAYGQFDMGAIIVWLQSVQQSLNSTMMPIMSDLNTVSKNMQQFQQSVMYPLNQITAIESRALTLYKDMTTMNTLMGSPINSATLPATQTLESQLLGGNANNISGLGTSYYNVFGVLPASTALAPDMRSTVDMNDAQAQDAFKTAVKLDAIANTEAQLAQQYMQQLQSTAPGVAPLVQAQAAAWNLEAAAYTQQGMDELLRTQASITAYQSFNIKHASTTHQQGLQLLGIPPN